MRSKDGSMYYLETLREKGNSDLFIIFSSTVSMSLDFVLSPHF